MKKYLILLAMLWVAMFVNADDVKRPDTYNYNRGLEKLSNENLEDALKYLNKELDENPKNGYALYYIAIIHYSQDEYGRALTTVDLALKNIPKKDAEVVAAAYNVRADIHMALEDTIKAIDDYASAIKVCPTGGNAYEKRAQIHYEQQKYDLSDADFRQLIQLDQGSLVGYMGIGRNCFCQKRWDEAIEQFNIVIKMYNDYSRAYSFRAEAFLAKERWAEATDDIVSALSIDGDDKAFVIMQGLKEPAFGMLKAKLKIQGMKNPNNPYWPYCIAVMYERNGEYEEAIPFYKEANSKDANYINLKRIAGCYYNIGDYNNALRYINQAIELDSTIVENISFKIDILENMGMIKETITELDKFLSLFPESDAAYYQRGWNRCYTGDEEGAIEDFTMLVTLDPEDAYSYVARADAYSRQGKTELAKADYLKVIELENSPEEYGCIHHAYQALGETEKAIAAIDTIIARNVDNNGVYYDAACLYSRMKNKEKALEYLGKCLEMGYNQFAHIRVDFDIDFIREEPEFKALIEKYESAAKAKFRSSSEHKQTSEGITTEIPFTKENGTCNVKCKINDLPLYFVFDTGASTVSLSMVEATFMMKNGYLDKRDVIGSEYFLDANGNINEGSVVNIRNVEFGGLKLENVRASVVKNQKAPLLLGQSVLGRLGTIEIDNNNHMLRINR